MAWPFLEGDIFVTRSLIRLPLGKQEENGDPPRLQL